MLKMLTAFKKKQAEGSDDHRPLTDYRPMSYLDYIYLGIITLVFVITVYNILN